MFTLLAAVPAQGQQAQQQVARQQQMQQMQQRMQQLDQMTQRMERLQEQVRSMNRMLQQDMDRLRVQDQTRAQDRLRQSERIRDMGESMGLMAQQMRQAMLRLREVAGDPATGGDPAMVRTMERMQEHLRAMGDQLEEGLRIMEQLHQRLREGGPGSR
ncbi:MAG: hypothetical protein RQ751_09420 [Longimicrobiales bacterium]|nr:hypothetical protein [Longimicrobiales bacterium]